MNTQFRAIVLGTAIAFLFCACTDRQADSPSTPEAVSSAPMYSAPLYSVTDQWLGQWNRPEGTFLKITGGEGKYEIIIQNLDGPKNYTGVSVDNGIQFERDGIMEKIKATNGAETGMKWLREKSNCLTIHKGEGFCKD